MPTSSTVPVHQPLMDLDPEAIRCPYPYFEQMRREGPLHPVPELGFHIVSRYEDILEVVRKPEVFSSSMVTGPHIVQTMMALVAEHPELQALMQARAVNEQPVLLNADPPLHDRQRKLVNKAFSPRRVNSMEDGIRSIANDLVDEFIDEGRVELVKQFAVLLPLIVIADALGVPRKDMPTFKRWSDDFVAQVGNHKLSAERLLAIAKSQEQFHEYFRAKIEERRATPQDNLISDVVASKIDGDELTMEEMLGMFMQFLVAGNETTTKMITSAMMLLLDNPLQMAAVRADHGLIVGLVEEALRLETPVQGLFRTALVDTEIGGAKVLAGTHLMLLYASANRDDAVFEQPDLLDPARENAKAHLAFSQGPHYCLGATLARAEGRIAFEILLSRLDNIRLADTNTFEFDESYLMHGLKELHLEFDRV